MAITKEAVIEKIEVVGSWNIQVATDTVIKAVSYTHLRAHET